ncbi:hypothetical protein [Thermoflexus sp.]|uniref:hypothetical protein n=1 Tax=Thermoflexus sp. TaxID=1969742 RepID=UPI002ADD673A|nr:hypothetical protein [Thermoflexus sp.]
MDPQAPQTINLDRLAIQQAQWIMEKVDKKRIQTVERLANKAIGVLQEQGVYALLLFLFSRGGDEREVAPVIRQALYAAIKELPDINERFKQTLSQQSDANDRLLVLQGYADHVLSDLDTLLLVQELYRQILIYTLYSAKAVGG